MQNNRKSLENQEKEFENLWKRWNEAKNTSDNIERW